MLFYQSNSVDPRYNLALEEYLFEYMDASQSYFMLWQNDNTIVIGRNQNTVSEINPDFVRSRDITVVRRLSGGGAVYHDLGNLNFTFITDAQNMERVNLQVFCQPIVDALRSFGVEAELSGRNDITVCGKKISGNAQYMKRGRVMHHGTLLFDSDLTIIGKALHVDREKIASKGIQSVESRVTNLREHLPPEVTMEQFRQRLLQYLAVQEPLLPLSLPSEAEAVISRLSRERYGSWEWTYGKSPSYSTIRKGRLEGCGTVEVSLSVDQGLIESLCFHGDFFSTGNPEELATALIGCPCRRSAVEKRLSELDTDWYLTGSTPHALAELIVP